MQKDSFLTITKAVELTMTWSITMIGSIFGGVHRER
jgi:hypothetical protein